MMGSLLFNQLVRSQTAYIISACIALCSFVLPNAELSGTACSTNSNAAPERTIIDGQIYI
jgi:hypothetical protein